MDITECVTEGGGRIYRTLYRYVIDDNPVNNKTVGHFEKVNPISEALQQKFLQYGVPRNEIRRFAGKEA
jgi:hypothetical protein